MDLPNIMKRVSYFSHGVEEEKQTDCPVAASNISRAWTEKGQTMNLLKSLPGLVNSGTSETCLPRPDILTARESQVQLKKKVGQKVFVHHKSRSKR